LGGCPRWRARGIPPRCLSHVFLRARAFGHDWGDEELVNTAATVVATTAVAFAFASFALADADAAAFAFVASAAAFAFVASAAASAAFAAVSAAVATFTYHATGDIGMALWAGTAAIAFATAIMHAVFARRSRVLAALKGAVAEATKAVVEEAVRDEIADLRKKLDDNLSAMNSMEEDNRRIVTALLEVAGRLAAQPDSDTRHELVRQLAAHLAAKGVDPHDIESALSRPRAQA